MGWHSEALMGCRSWEKLGCGSGPRERVGQTSR